MIGRTLILMTVKLFCLSLVNGLDNGLALTPPMGWLSWERFRCTVDCKTYPAECISEQLIRDMADRMAGDGYLEAGYEYVIIDDCWLAPERDEDGKLQPDPDRFPSGIKDLADYVHSKGLKFGIYEDYGEYTCAGYPGILGHLETDAATFAEWGVDYLKLDGCNVEIDKMEEGYFEMGAYLNQTGRPIVYSCSFPAYEGLDANYTAAMQTCNLWRNYLDIDDSWSSVKSIVEWFTDNQGFINKYAGPGHWNDPDMLIIGNEGLTLDQSIAQMTMWSLMAAPLLMSVDLRTIEPQFVAVLLNVRAIQVNQDPLGKPGLLTWQNDNVRIWTKQILPQIEGDYSYAFGFVSFREDAAPYVVEITLEQFGLTHENGYLIRNVFGEAYILFAFPTDTVQVVINPTGAVLYIIQPYPTLSTTTTTILTTTFTDTTVLTTTSPNTTL